jgi:hypothetical protein
MWVLTQIISHRRGEKITRHEARSYVSIVAAEKVDVIGMTRDEYARYATHGMLQELVNAKMWLNVPLRDLQESVIRSNSDRFERPFELDSRERAYEYDA